MSERLTVPSGGDYEDVYGYSRAVRVGPQVHLAGTCARGEDLDGDTYAQSAAALRIIVAALQEAGASARDVVPDRRRPAPFSARNGPPTRANGTSSGIRVRHGGRGQGYSAGMSEYSAGQVDGPSSGASDNAAENADPQVRDDVLGQRAQEGVTDADRGLGGDDAGSRAPGDTTQPRTGAETPVDAEDLVHARGQDVTDATLRRAREDLDDEGAAAVEREVPDLAE